jgi:hypothetical protein
MPSEISPKKLNSKAYGWNWADSQFSPVAYRPTHISTLSTVGNVHRRFRANLESVRYAGQPWLYYVSSKSKGAWLIESYSNDGIRATSGRARAETGRAPRAL